MKLIGRPGAALTSAGALTNYELRALLLAMLVGSVAACGSGSTPDSGTAGSASGGSPSHGGGTVAGGGSAPQSEGGSGNGGTMSSGGGMAGHGGSSAGGNGGLASGGAGDGGTAGGASDTLFSFFVTSQAGLIRLSKNEKGFGGDLKYGKADGLSGADEICRQLAEASLPGNGKTWRAFLSATKGSDGNAVNAIDRIGEGPWYDRLGRLIAMDKAALLQERPAQADPAIKNDLPNEDGVPNHDPGTGIVDNHNVLTGSTEAGTLDDDGLSATCQDWTSSTSSGGRPRCGVTWPRSSIKHWISVLNESGCAPGATPPGAESGPQGTVGGLGGYGGFYCFALSP
jgi:hypothetical protein